MLGQNQMGGLASSKAAKGEDLARSGLGLSNGWGELGGPRLRSCSSPWSCDGISSLGWFRSPFVKRHDPAPRSVGSGLKGEVFLGPQFVRTTRPWLISLRQVRDHVVQLVGAAQASREALFALHCGQPPIFQSGFDVLCQEIRFTIHSPPISWQDLKLLLSFSPRYLAGF